MRKTARVVVVAALAVGALASAAGADNRAPIPVTFELDGVSVAASLLPETVEVLFNPSEYAIDKAAPWKHHDIGGLDAPRLEFTSGEPFRMQVELFFDRYEEGKDVRELTDRFSELGLCVLVWGTKRFKCVLESFSVKFTLFLDNGTPVRAVMNTVWKEFSPADEQLKGKPRH